MGSISFMHTLRWDSMTLLHAKGDPVFDKKKEIQCSFKRSSSRNRIIRLEAFEHDHMEQVFRCDVGVYDKTEGREASNKSIKRIEATTQGNGNQN